MNLRVRLDSCVTMKDIEIQPVLPVNVIISVYLVYMRFCLFGFNSRTQ